MIIANRIKKFGALLSGAALLASCGGGGGSSSPPPVQLPPTTGPAPAPTPTPTGTTCSLTARQNWVRAQMDEWYLFPETLPTSLNPASFDTVQAYIDALTATAREQGRDRFFTFITSIEEENAFFESGATAGFGVRLSYDEAAGTVTVIEAFENAPAFPAGLDRGARITGIGTSADNIASVADLFAQGGRRAVSDAFGPSTAGTARVLRFVNPAGETTTTTVTKANFALQPLSPRYGTRVIDDGGRKVGYINLRTFIDSANDPLIAAFDSFRAQGISEFVIDFRYNGGGLVGTADLIGDLLGGNRRPSDQWSFTRYRPSKSERNSSRNFRPRAESVNPLKIAFIGTGATASASELVINGMDPYLQENMALVGGNTFGKPVGQIGLDRAECDDRLRVVAFSKDNADGEGDYFAGLADTLPRTCRAEDDLTAPLGDAREASIAQALGFLAGESCTPITVQTASANGRDAPNAQRARLNGGEIRASLRPLRPTAPTPAQREVPGLF